MFEVLHDSVLIKELEEKTTEGLFVVSAGQEKKDRHDMKQGVVVAAGPGKHQNGQLIKSPLKEGDKVLFAKGISIPVTIEGQNLLLVNMEAILVRFSQK